MRHFRRYTAASSPRVLRRAAGALGPVVAASTLVALLSGSALSADRPFSLELIDDGGGESTIVGETPSLAVDSRGDPHVVYYNASIGGVYYARRASGTWLIETIDGDPLSGEYCALALDRNDDPHVSYYNAEGGDLRYATRLDGGPWSIETADGAGIRGTWTSIAVDADLRPNIAYRDELADFARWARKEGAVWTIEQTGVVATGQHNSIAVGANGTPHVTQWASDANAVRIAARVGPNVWNLLHTLFDVLPPGHSSIALDSRDRIHVIYHHMGDRAAVAIVEDPVAATIEEDIPQNHINEGEYTDIAVDADGTAHVVYRTVVGARFIKYAQRTTSGAWTVQLLVDDPRPNEGIGSSIALDGQGNPMVAYHVAYDGSLMFADGSVRLLSPLGGETWPVGAEREVRWSGAGEVDILLSTDGGRTYDVVAENLHASPVTLRVPHAPTRYARVKIRRSAPFSEHASDSLFTVDASVTLLRFGATLASEAGGAVRLDWHTSPGPSDLAGYRLERARGAHGWTEVGGLVRATTFEDLEGRPGDRYRLSAVNGWGDAHALGEVRVGRAVALGAWPLPYRGGTLTVSFGTLGGIGGWNAPAEVAVYDLAGRRLRTIASGTFGAGQQIAAWDGRDARGRPVRSGTYFLRVESAGNTTSMKLPVVR